MTVASSSWPINYSINFKASENIIGAPKMRNNFCYSNKNTPFTNIRDSDSCRSFSILKTIAKRKGKLLRARKIQKTEISRNAAKMIKSYNFTRSYREKFSFAIAILGKGIFG